MRPEALVKRRLGVRTHLNLGVVLEESLRNLEIVRGRDGLYGQVNAAGLVRPRP